MFASAIASNSVQAALGIHHYHGTPEPECAWLAYQEADWLSLTPRSRSIRQYATKGGYYQLSNYANSCTSAAGPQAGIKALHAMLPTAGKFLGLHLPSSWQQPGD